MTLNHNNLDLETQVEQLKHSKYNAKQQPLKGNPY